MSPIPPPPVDGGGGGGTPDPNSVGPTELQNNAVTNPKLAPDAVDASKVLDHSLGYDDLDVQIQTDIDAAAASADAATVLAQDHIADTTDAHDASAISNVPAGSVAATDVQGAITELDSEKASTGSVTTVQSNLTTHIADATDAHDGTAITNTPAGTVAATTVQAAINELDSEKATTGSVTAVQSNLTTHVANPTGAHAGTAVSNTPAGNIAATTVQAAINELDSEKLPSSSVGAPGGAASLDGGGKVPASQLPSSVMELQGEWNATTNSPALADGVGNAGDVYRVSVAGTQNLGSGNQTFAVNDTVWYAADNIWHRSDNSDAVTSVNGFFGAVALGGVDIPVPPSGNLGTSNVRDQIVELDSEKTNQTDFQAHLDDTTDAHDASAISSVATGDVAATDVQSAIAELASEKATTGSVTTVQSNLTAHIADATDAHDGTAITNTPAGNVAATTVQAAINELDTEKATTGSVTTVQSNLTTHINNATDAHDASAISILDTANDFTAVDVEGALAELQSDAEADEAALAAHIADATDAHAGTAITNVPAGTVAATTVQAAINELDTEKATTGSVTTVQSNLDAHINDTTDAHAGTAITNVPAGTVAAVTVQAAINELDTEKATTGSVTAVQSNLTTHINNATDAHDASAISFVAGGTIAATDAQTAIAEVATDAASALTAHTGSATAHAAANLTNAPAGNVAATTVQGAINELDTEKVSIAGSDTITGKKTISNALRQAVQTFNTANTISITAGEIVNWTGTTGTLNLPPAVAGDRLDVRHTGASGVLTLDLDGADTANGGTVNPAINVGDRAELVALANNTWAINYGWRLIGTSTVLAGTTYTPPAGVRALEVTVVGGGGSGGSCAATAAGTASAGAGGGSGGASKTFLTGAALKTSYTVAIGAGGTPAAAGNNAGGNGGATTFDSPSVCSASGGGGGAGSAAVTPPALVSQGGGSGVGSLGNMINLNGTIGKSGTAISVGSQLGGDGSYAPLIGASGGRGSNSGAGIAAQGNTGSGGGGGAAGGGTAAQQGGTGGSGLIIVREYA